MRPEGSTRVCPMKLMYDVTSSVGTIALADGVMRK